MDHIFLIQPSIAGHVGCFHVLAPVNDAAMHSGASPRLTVNVARTPIISHLRLAFVPADTERLYSVVFGEICGRYGKKYSWDVKSLVMGKKALEAAQIIIDVLQLPTTKEELVDESQAKLKELFPTAALMPGCHVPLPFQEQGGLIPPGGGWVECYQVSSMEPTCVPAHAKVLNPAPRPASDWDRGRLSPKGSAVWDQRALPPPSLSHSLSLSVPACPPPSDGDKEGGLACTSVRRAHPSQPSLSHLQCLVFEDAPNGVEAALAAGMQVVMVPDGNLRRELTTKATLVLASLQDFQPQLFWLHHDTQASLWALQTPRHPGLPLIPMQLRAELCAVFRREVDRVDTESQGACVSRGGR
ncbi:PREDICTED: pseudouridine-5'-phosphatase [Myotis brandtii]|uniref:pseudouridine-5'-phosphatase n=1 Tax=Myotis brandtii TaxID=109478 RepID=UPI0007046844|nr:PREDICTED: pseudouridine-5'-phosphatase [Myotis brandtii]